jgi:hypothetical protein
MEISWTDRVRNKVLHRVKEERNILLHTVNKKEAKWIGHILRRNCLLKLVIVGKIVRAVRRGRRRKQILDDPKERRGYWKSEEEALDRTLWRTCMEEAVDL